VEGSNNHKHIIITSHQPGHSPGLGRLN
jgi:hypothetical protein